MPLPMSFFPYGEPRPFQEELMLKLSAGHNIFCNAPTGVGKSISSLCSFISEREKGEKIVVLTRTKSQAKIFLTEVAKISEHIDKPLLAIQLRSKQEVCPLFKEPETIYEEFVQLCNLKSDCPHREAFFKKRNRLERLAKEIAADRTYADFRTLSDKVSEYGCPYLVLQGLANYSDIIIASYLYMLNPFLRGVFLRKVDRELDELLVIVDEAHNLQNADLLGKSLSRATLDMAAKELSYDFSRIYSMFEGEDKALKILELVHPEEIQFLLDRGVEVLGSRMQKGKKISYTFRVASFIDTAIRTSGEKNWMFFRKEGKLFVKPIFPSDMLEPLKGAKKLAFMSGTLEPVEGYKALYGFEEADEISLPKIFPRENCPYFGIKKSINTGLDLREDEGADLWKKYAEAITDISAASPMTTLVFFPSYEIMGEVKKHVKAFSEPSDSSELEKFWKDIRNKEKKTVLAVSGGKLSEGVEYTVSENGKKRSVVSALIVAGFPFPVPDFELKLKGALYEQRFGFGKSFLLLSVLPMVNKVLQDVGRAIRSESDRAAVILLDDRLEHLKYFPEEVRHEIQVCKLQDIKKEVEWFYRKI